MAKKVEGVELPSTLERSPKQAQHTFAKTLRSAKKSYGGDGERARRAAFSSLKHSFEKEGDHWEAKDEKGPSDPQAAKDGARARKGGKTDGGVDVEGHTVAELRERARDLGVERTSKMKKADLAEAIAKKQRNLAAKARRKKS
ncbi:ChaB family protein [soil metagenome]